jgi:hypothetical protein
MGMVAYLMAFGQYTFVELWIFSHIIAHHKEGGFHTKLLQRVKDKWCSLWDGTVVESQVY